MQSPLQLVNYIVLDATRLEHDLETAFSYSSEHVCLYSEELAKDLRGVAPYLFDFDATSEFAKWLQTNGFGCSWGIFIQSGVSRNELLRHLQKFILVQTELKEEFFFRFYDPRVLSVFLPTCTSEQLREFFGPIRYFYSENEDGLSIIRWSLQNDQLKTEVLSIDVYASVSSESAGTIALKDDPILTIKPNPSPPLKGNSWID
jgi:hypothetical protein